MPNDILTRAIDAVADGTHLTADHASAVLDEIMGAGDGYVKLVHKGTTQCLDVDNNLSNPGTAVHQYTDNGNDAQRWKLDLMPLPLNSGRGALAADEAVLAGTSLQVYPVPASGQVHCLLTQFKRKPDDTDLAFMPA